jgi:hypothetical protein
LPSIRKLRKNTFSLFASFPGTRQQDKNKKKRQQQDNKTTTRHQDNNKTPRQQQHTKTTTRHQDKNNTPRQQQDTKTTTRHQDIYKTHSRTMGLYQTHSGFKSPAGDLNPPHAPATRVVTHKHSNSREFLIYDKNKMLTLLFVILELTVPLATSVFGHV